MAAEGIDVFWKHDNWVLDFQEKLRAKHKAGKKLTVAQHTWVLFDLTDRACEKRTTINAWDNVVKEYQDNEGAGIRKKRRSFRVKGKRKPSKKYRSRRRKYTKRR